MRYPAWLKEVAKFCLGFITLVWVFYAVMYVIASLMQYLISHHG